MPHTLIPHPDWPPGAELQIAVSAERDTPERLALRFHVTGEIGKVRLPAGRAGERRDRLWEHTCFEAFVRPGEGPGYCEFNFAHAGGWAAYRFTGYREGMADADPLEAPVIERPLPGREYELGVTLDVTGLRALVEADWRVGLSAVVETLDGARSYWALAHPPGKADFHHPDCFALHLPAPHRT